jgi:ADP-heptose:LPS heptosyltransferase
MGTIYIFRPGALGDTLIAAPVLKQLKESHKIKDIVFISERGSNSFHVSPLQLKDLIPEISDAILFPNDNFFNKLNFLKINLRPQKDDLLLYLNYSGCSYFHVMRDFLFFKFLGFKNTSGFLNYLKTRNKAKSYFIPEYIRLFLVAKDLISSDLIISDYRLLGLNSPCKLNSPKSVFVAPFGKAKSKRWPLENYEIVFKFLQKNNYQIVICGSDDEQLEYNNLLWETKFNAKSYFGLPLVDLHKIILKCSFYLGNDTGPMHLAALSGLRCLCLFSETNRDANWEPYGSDHVVMRELVSCSNCHLTICNTLGHPCMTNISPDSVIKELSVFLND